MVPLAIVTVAHNDVGVNKICWAPMAIALIAPLAPMAPLVIVPFANFINGTIANGANGDCVIRTQQMLLVPMSLCATVTTTNGAI